MRAKILNYSGYRYPHKDTGELKEGTYISIEEMIDFAEDDNNHNFSYGHNVKNVRLTNTVMQNHSHYDIIDMVGKEVECIFATAPGSKIDVLVDIKEV